jgi:hypothetical protein
MLPISSNISKYRYVVLVLSMRCGYLYLTSSRIAEEELEGG